jgi:hypothetical protein
LSDPVLIVLARWCGGRSSVVAGEAKRRGDRYAGLARQFTPDAKDRDL